MSPMIWLGLFGTSDLWSLWKGICFGVFVLLKAALNTHQQFRSPSFQTQLVFFKQDYLLKTRTRTRTPNKKSKMPNSKFFNWKKADLHISEGGIPYIWLQIILARHCAQFQFDLQKKKEKGSKKGVQKCGKCKTCQITELTMSTTNC